MNKFLFDLHSDENDYDDDDYDDKDYDNDDNDDDDDDAILPTSSYLIFICDNDDFLQHLAFRNKFLFYIHLVQNPSNEFFQVK